MSCLAYSRESAEVQRAALEMLCGVRDPTSSRTRLDRALCGRREDPVMTSIVPIRSISGGGEAPSRSSFLEGYTHAVDFLQRRQRSHFPAPAGRDGLSANG